MECNKEEALRAREIAEKKMENKDYAGARKIATKAQNLYPDLENILQMICVCEVHCSAETIVFGNEKDWYSILQVNPAADDALIKRQYRKLALLLHPDKNKFAGAEAAFKLIGEAQRTLLDSQKKSLFDLRWKTLNRPMAPYRPPRPPPNSSMKQMPNKQQGVDGNFAANVSSFAKVFNFSSHQQAQSAVPNGQETFWTMCPSCLSRYQYHMVYLNKSISCPACKKSFITFDVLQAMPSKPNVHQATSSSTKTSEPSKPTDVRVSGLTSEPSKPTDVRVSGMTSELSKGAKRTNEPKMAEGSGNLKKMDKIQLSESSESFGSESSSDSDESDSELDVGVEQGMNVGDESSYRRSTRNRRRVSYNEGASDDEEMLGSSKRTKVDGSFSHTEKVNGVSSSNVEMSENNKPSGSGKNVNQGANGMVNGFASMAGENQTESPTDDDVSTSSSGSEVSQEPDVQECPDPEFNDFDGLRSKEQFKIGQIWAVYDTLDAMPRFYAEIRKVFSPGFKLKITWLEADPDEDQEVLRANKELPVACGKFKYGDSQIEDSHLMFSHPILFERCGREGILKIYPKKNETWAIFKDWHIGWINQFEERVEYKYDYVEVLSEYDQILGTRVGFLGKLRGFSSLFCRKSGEELQIPTKELLRFSHRVPSFKMSGRERGDVPQGAFELDPACVSLNLEEIPVPSEMKSASESVEANLDSKLKGEASSSQNKGTRVNDTIRFNDNDLESYFSVDGHCDTPEPEFYDFEGAKALDKLEINQIWALYSDTDGMPKYYGLIKKINPRSDTKVEIVWLDSLPLPDELIEWKDEEIPVTCGRFKVMGKARQPYDDLAAFSHQVPAVATAKTIFEIYPRKGEIWALYKDWSVEMSASELLCCEYDVVEVVDVDSSFIRVSSLERVSDFKTVVKTKINESSPVTMVISYKELLRFSHQIPSYQLTDERNASLRGCWELDPNALPAFFFSS